MGYYCAIGTCGLCDQTFTFNPERVPCFPLLRSKAPPMDIQRFDPKANKEPVCKPCFEAINRWRVEHELEPHTHLKDAWGATEAL